jgi:hypothetical protein
MKQEFNKSQIELQQYLEAQNAKLAEWVAQDPANRFCGKISSDPAYWAARAIFSLDEYLFAMAKFEYSDTYKDFWGVRPDLSGLTTLAEVEAAIASVIAEMKSADREEERLDVQLN